MVRFVSRTATGLRIASLGVKSNMQQPPITPFRPQPEEPSRKGPFWEDLIVLLAIPVLWIFVLRRQGIEIKGPLPIIAVAATVLALLWILKRRIRRLNESADRGGQPPPGPKELS